MYCPIFFLFPSWIQILRCLPHFEEEFLQSVVVIIIPEGEEGVTSLFTAVLSNKLPQYQHLHQVWVRHRLCYISNLFWAVTGIGKLIVNHGG